MPNRLIIPGTLRHARNLWGARGGIQVLVVDGMMPCDARKDYVHSVRSCFALVARSSGGTLGLQSAELFAAWCAAAID